METLIAICENYIRELEPMRAKSVGMYSYSVWAIREVLKSIPKYPDLSPIGLVCVMHDKFDRYSCIDPRTSFMFSVAKDATDYILDELLDERRNYD